MQPPQPRGLDAYRGVINGFIVGLIVGMLIGWMFHGLVGLAVRLGFALFLLIPLAIVIWFFFLRRSGSRGPDRGDRQGGVQVYTWSSDQVSQRYTTDPRQPPPPDAGQASRQRTEEVIDIEFDELKRQVDEGGRN